MAPTVTAQALHDALLASDSATAVLEAICGAPVRIVRAAGAPRLAPRHLIQGQHRRVALICAERRLSEADLWFRADLLPAAMVTELSETDAPFGRVVRRLGLRRRTLSARICAAGEPYALVHHAVLSDQSEDIAEVAERYCWNLITPSRAAA